MNQKTIKMSDFSAFDQIPAVGDEVILIERVPEGLDAGAFSIVPHKGCGIGGNMNPNVTRYHGWRGTSYGVAKYAHGARKIVKIENLGWSVEEAADVYKITVGKDIFPDAD